jgi:hypothetical protein
MKRFWFKNFAHVVLMISGIELAQKIKKGQFNTSRMMIGAGAAIADSREKVRAA